MRNIIAIKTINGIIEVNNNIGEVINNYFKDYRTPYSVPQIRATQNELVYTIRLVDGPTTLVSEDVEVLFSD